jgi:uncharacterized protein
VDTAAEQSGDPTRRSTRLDEADGAARVARLDYGTIGKVRRTPQGGRIADARLTRTGVFRYLNHDGTERRELRLPEEVFKADSLATLADAPVTDGHPDEPVTPATYSKVARGHVRGDAKREADRFVAAELALQDADLISKAERGDQAEVSCGYTCELELKAGEYNGERYDAIQRDIEYNHVALVKRGRAGREVSLRLDAAEQVDSEDKGSRRINADEEHHMKPKYRIDGIDYEVGSPEFMQALQKRDERRDAEIVELKAERDKLQGERDGLKTKLDKAEGDLKKATDPTAIAAAVKARVDLEQDARAIGGDEIKLDGLTDRDVMIAAIRHVDEKFDAKDRSDDYVRGRFETLAETHRSDDEDGGRGINAARAAVRKAKGRTDRDEDERADEDGDRGRRDDREPDADRARQKMIERNRKASEQPFRFQVKEG